MINKLTTEQEKRFDSCIHDGQVYDYEDNEITLLVKDFLADEIARAREDSARGFLDYMNDKELWNSHWDKVEIISRVEDYVKKLKE